MSGRRGVHIVRARAGMAMAPAMAPAPAPAGRPLTAQRACTFVYA